MVGIKQKVKEILGIIEDEFSKKEKEVPSVKEELSSKDVACVIAGHLQDNNWSKSFIKKTIMAITIEDKETLDVIILTPTPGIIIGKGGSTIESLGKAITDEYGKTCKIGLVEASPFSNFYFREEEIPPFDAGEDFDLRDFLYKYNAKQILTGESDKSDSKIQIADKMVQYLVCEEQWAPEEVRKCITSIVLLDSEEEEMTLIVGGPHPELIEGPAKKHLKRFLKIMHEHFPFHNVDIKITPYRPFYGVLFPEEDF